MYIKILKKFNTTWLFFTFFIYNLILTIPMKYPFITDEYGALANAVYLSGRYDWSSAYSTSIQNYWGYGSTIWLIPFLNLFSGIESGKAVFKLMLVFNAFLVSFIPVLVYQIIRSLQNVTKVCAAMIACCTGLFPAYTVLSKYAWGETALSVLPWVTIFLLIQLVEENIALNKKRIFSALLGLTLAFAWSVHGRALALIAATIVIVFIASLFLKKSLVSWFFFVLPIILGFAADSSIKHNIIANLIMSDPDSTRNTASSILSRNISGAPFIRSVWQIVKATLGMSYYDLVITFGLGSFALVKTASTAIQIVKKRFHIVEKKSYREIILDIFSLTLFLSQLILSVIFFSSAFIAISFQRREYFIYGRYTEAAAGMMLTVALYSLFFSKKSFSTFKIASSSITVLGVLWGTFITSRSLIHNSSKTMSYSMVSGIIPWGGSRFLYNTTFTSCLKIAILIIIFYILIMFLTHKHYFKSVCFVISCLFLYSTLYSLITFVWPSSQRTYSSTESIRQTFNSFYDINEKYNQVFCLKESGRVLTLQYTLPDFEVTYLNKDKNGYQSLENITENSFIISDEKDLLNEILPNCLPIQMSDESYYLWVYGEQLIEELKRRGVYFSAPQMIRQYHSEALSRNEFALKNDTSMFLFKDGLSYGPYVTLPPGKYTITIKGKLISIGHILLTTYAGKQTITPETFSVVSSDEISLTFTINEIVHNFEVLIRNPTNSTIIVSEINIENKEFVASQLDDLEVPTRDYSVANKNTRDTIVHSKGCIRGQIDILFSQDDMIQIKDIYLLDKEYKISVYGERLTGTNIALYNESGEIIPIIYSQEESDDNCITYYLKESQKTKNAYFIIEGTNENMSKFKKVGISLLCD